MWPLFVNKQLFWWSISKTLDNDNDVFFNSIAISLYTLPHISVGLSGCNVRHTGTCIISRLICILATGHDNNTLLSIHLYISIISMLRYL